MRQPDEITVMKRCLKALNTLGEDERKRALDWLWLRVNEDLNQIPITAVEEEALKDEVNE